MAGGGESRAEHRNETQRAPRIAKSNGTQVGIGTVSFTLYTKTPLCTYSPNTPSHPPHTAPAKSSAIPAPV
jgi:hypothetical protein